MIATAKDVRAWSIKFGVPVGKRGPIAKDVWDYYLEDHPEASN